MPHSGDEKMQGVVDADADQAGAEYESEQMNFPEDQPGREERRGGCQGNHQYGPKPGTNRTECEQQNDGEESH